ncbi:peptidase inhibitor family I36 protein [Streptomyces olivaceoviridis]|uniref:peptidase inhibitor family I36 protein n=1 Tax=Streptomyces olivaceoviridis TaxID=1921 RepID=UPI0036C56181
MRVLRVKAALSAAALAGALALTAAAPASAAQQPNSHWPVSYACFWTWPDYTGTMTVYPNAHEAGDCTGITGSASSLFNKDGQPWCTWGFYRDNGCRAYAYTLQPGESETFTRVNSWT